MQSAELLFEQHRYRVFTSTEKFLDTLLKENVVSKMADKNYRFNLRAKDGTYLGHGKIMSVIEGLLVLKNVFTTSEFDHVLNSTKRPLPSDLNEYLTCLVQNDILIAYSSTRKNTLLFKLK